MTTKSNFREGLDQPTPEQFERAKQDFAAASAARGDTAEFNRKVANMTPRQLEEEWAKYR